jgi:hypothetical protein
VSLEQAQLEIGIQIPLLEAPFNTYWFLLMKCWFKPLWQFILVEGIILKKEDPITLPETVCCWRVMPFPSLVGCYNPLAKAVEAR